MPYVCHELTVPRHLYAYGVLAYGHMHCKMSAPTSVTNSRATNSLYRATCVYMSCTRTHTYTHTHIHTSYPVPTGDKLFTIYFVCVVKYTETHDTLDIVRTPYAYNTHIIHRIEHADHDTLPIRYTLHVATISVCNKMIQVLCVVKLSNFVCSKIHAEPHDTLPIQYTLPQYLCVIKLSSFLCVVKLTSF